MTKTWKQIKEDNGVSASNGVPANNVAGGAVAGIGIGPYGEPPGRLYRKNKKLKGRGTPSKSLRSIFASSGIDGA